MKKQILSLALALVLAVSLAACRGSGAPEWREKYDLGVRYLSEENYREAIAAFQAAIGIEPKRAELYLGLADVYAAMGDVEETARVLNGALEAVEDTAGVTAIRARLDELAAEPKTGARPGPEPETEPKPEPGESTWTLTDGTLTIEVIGPMEDYAYPDDCPPWYDHSFEITALSIGGGVTRIGNDAFSFCDSLANITIPSSVASIGDWAFNNCANLTSVTISDSVVSIGDGAFSGCYFLPSVAIPNSVTGIGDSAFAWCGSLMSVTIPDSVTSIGNGAFSDCTSLTDIYYGGTAEQWASLAAGAEVPSTATIHYNA